VFFGLQLGMASISILAVVLLFMFRVVEWKDLQEKNGMGRHPDVRRRHAISSILNSTGAGIWFTKRFVLPHLDSPWMLMLALSFLSILLAEAMSPSCVVAIVVPIGMSGCETVRIGSEGCCLRRRLSVGTGLCPADEHARRWLWRIRRAISE
jgi:sodium-dependent dicarboxylate transporter 2/3/5